MSSEHSRPAPRAPYYDADLGVWVLSRFADVSAALLQPQLCLVGPNGDGQLDIEDRAASKKSRTDVLAALQARIGEWRAEFAPIAEEIASALPEDRVVDLIGEFARPWSLLLAARVVGVSSDEARRLAPLAETVTASTADAENAALKTAAAFAGTELDKAVVDSRLPMPGPAFVAMSQTLPCLLANAWLILFRHPEEMRQIRANAGLLPKAVEELLRLAVLARVVHRRATSDAKVGDLAIQRGQRLHLMIEAANYDPEQFPEPERLDLSRRAVGHFSMGAGDHSCAAVALIRMAMGLATGIVVNKFVPAQPSNPIQWRGGSGFRWPVAVYARKHSQQD